MSNSNWMITGFYFSDIKDMALAPCKLMQIREIVMWQLAISSELPHFYKKKQVAILNGYSVKYENRYRIPE